MKHCIIYAHPNQFSFNHAIKEKVINLINSRGDQYDLIDLYQEQFQPVLSANDFIALQNNTVNEELKRHQKLVSDAQNLIFIYPIWWFGQPAILKGWIDRVFSSGFAYREDEKGFTPLLSDKSATLIVTLGSQKETLLQYGIDDFVKNMTVGTLNLVGISNINCQQLYAVPSLTSSERHTMLENITI
ncbi:NAD(P)H-dependent oxidoreductase [Snodgrassella gandavensis]|uniref:NAD(P)H-dependent oxidoreductase n=1 Tax=Snodgrassella gandavensis TaxID=2946698 RepID=UPI001EF5AC44|nr:NAD(P)H-dependent oxidoreductase [Snodgrassella gandavensis]